MYHNNSHHNVLLRLKQQNNSGITSSQARSSLFDLALDSELESKLIQPSKECSNGRGENVRKSTLGVLRFRGFTVFFVTPFIIHPSYGALEHLPWHAGRTLLYCCFSWLNLMIDLSSRLSPHLWQTNTISNDLML